MIKNHQKTFTFLNKEMAVYVTEQASQPGQLFFICMTGSHEQSQLADFCTFVALKFSGSLKDRH